MSNVIPTSNPPKSKKNKGNVNYWQKDYDYLHKLNADEYAFIQNFENTYSLGYANDDILSPEQRKERNHSKYVERTGKPLFTDKGILPDYSHETLATMNPETWLILKEEAELATKAKRDKKLAQRAKAQRKYADTKKLQKLPILSTPPEHLSMQSKPSKSRKKTTQVVTPQISQAQHEQLIASLSLSAAAVRHLMDNVEGARKADAQFAIGYINGMVEDVCASYVASFGEATLVTFNTTFQERYNV